MKFEFLLNIDNTIPRGERIKTDFRRLAFEVIRDTLKMDDKEFSDEIKKAAILKLYEMGKISSSIAAKTLGITRINFLEFLDKQKISYIDIKDSELEEDIRNA